MYKWLYPGMNVKRWLLLFSLGVLFVAAGLSVWLGRVIIGEFEQWLVAFARGMTGKYHGRPPLWLTGAVVVVVGCTLVILGIRQTMRSILGALMPEARGRLADMVHATRILSRGPKVVAVGGGTGLATLLRGLKELTSNTTAVVTVSDDGGSSGRIRREMGLPPPGDIRNCLVALADTEPLVERLFQYRFGPGSALEGHNFGNLFIAAMSEVTGDFEVGVRESSRVLAVRGQVLPSTLSNVVLCAELDDGGLVEGESRITGHDPGKRISKVFLKPPEAPALDEALEAIAQADIIVLGPGSLFTSVIPNLLVSGMAAAVTKSKAIKVYVCNVMTQPGETDGYTASDHLRAIVERLGRNVLDFVVVSTTPVPERLVVKYRQMGAHPVECDGQALASFGVRIVRADVTSLADLVRHDSRALAQVVIGLASPQRRRQAAPKTTLHT